VIADLAQGTAQAIYDGGHISGVQFVPARWPHAIAICGLLCKPCVAAPNIVRSVLCGARTDKSPGSARPTW
jgi:hypothetical protein